LAAAFVSLFAGRGFCDGDWPQWRGPNATGAVDAKDLPTTWSATENIVWKAALPSWSGSTPVIWGDKIFVASPSKPEEGASAEDARGGGSKLLLLCISKKDGTVLWERTLDEGNTFHSVHNDSSPSPVTDGKYVWAVTGTGAVVALTVNGDAVWKKNLQQDYGKFGHNFGYAAAPLLLDGKLIVEVLHGLKTDAASYVIAYDGPTGEVAWRVERSTDAVRESRDAYTTPVALQYGGKTQVVICGGDCVTGSDLETGKEIWRAGGLNPRGWVRNRIVVTPVVVGDLVVACSTKYPFMAVRAGGEGDVTATHVAWKLEKFDGPDVPTPAYDGKYLYVLNDRGLISCMDPKSGAVVWGPERTAQGIVSASPIVADGKLYVTNETGETTVMAAGPEFKVIARNTVPVEGKLLSSFAVSEGRLYLRTPSDLYCIGK
jgi:outer membrane protein assembly factor BamB